ncbi:hypothetical protein H5S40_03060 [Limosilactobacillus sp. RRLNB_1_1]|uniref:Uncharacterized protein n=1 Tax=Limosilactobacillus albertensis TaxID=2759752 RepID=A0A7W3TQZ1_9LACO|nr:hypothetical protein [Limosilactobacillus albertensis]MBB1069138.1 hypothetical protein [Limosilactobacillus albertensis]MCD7117451.1 hypothetical protein [Limosilactobacillus albertensis]MCD7127923.1 hypothetical protein [Limosilactobacillus albertensis]
MTNEEKINAIKQILGPEYEEVAIFAAKKSEIRDERTISLVDGDDGTVAAMIINYLNTSPVTTSIIKATIGTLKTDPTADLFAQFFLGGND